MHLEVCEPSERLYNLVRAACTANGMSFQQLCDKLSIKAQNARRALYGEWKGPKGIEVKDLLIQRSGLADD